MKVRLALAAALAGIAAAPFTASAQAVDACALIPHVAFINPDPTTPVRNACTSVVGTATCDVIPRVAFINPDPTAPARTACQSVLG